MQCFVSGECLEQVAHRRAHARRKQFFEDTTKAAAWRDLKWRNKIAAGFTNSGAQSGDKPG